MYVYFFFLQRVFGKCYILLAHCLGVLVNINDYITIDITNVTQEP